VGEPVGVAGQRGGLGQRGQSGKQGRSRVGGQILDVGDAAHADQLQGEQREHRGGRRNHPGAGVAGGRDQSGQVERDQVRHGQQQAGQLGLRSCGQRVEVAHRRAGQLVAAGQPASGFWPAPEPVEPLRGDHLGDPGAVQRGALRTQPDRDLVDRVPGPAQLDNPGSGGVLGRRGLGARPALGEERGVPGPEVSHHRLERRGLVAEPDRRLGRRTTLHEVGAQRLVAALPGRARGGEELQARPGSIGRIR
jgi:hypothetical protein